MTSLILTLEQEITFVCEGKEFKEVIVLGEAIEPGAAANQVEGVERQLKVDLSKIKFDTT